MNLIGNKKAVLDKAMSEKDAYELEKRYEGYKIPIVSDAMFRTMFYNESRKKYGCYLIALLLKKDFNEIYNNTTLIKANIDEEKENKSRKTVDYLCRIDDVVVNVEMNKNASKTSLARNLGYMFSLYNGGMSKGDDYFFETCIQININNFTFQGKNEVLDEYMIVNLKDSEEVYTNKIHIYNIYLPNIRKKDYNSLEEYEKLLLVFNENDNNILNELSKGDKIMKEYIDDSRKASEEDEVIGMYDKELHEERLRKSEIREANENGIQQGIQQGRSEGRKEERVSIAKQMIQDNVDLEVVSKYTGLSLDELQKLK